MRSFLSIICIITLISISLSCNKDPDQRGCMDPSAENYDPSALYDAGGCEYNTSQQFIFAKGKLGGWNGDLYQGAFHLEVCAGSVHWLEGKSETSDTTATLILRTDDDGKHKSYFKTINDYNGRDFAQGSLRIKLKRADSLSLPEVFRLFIHGSLQQAGECSGIRRSEYVEISTQSLVDSTYSEIVIPMTEFRSKRMKGIGVLCGIEFSNENECGVNVNEIRWVANAQE